MLTRIDIESENSFFLPILGITPKDPILLRKITGLNPPDLNLFIGDYSRDGGIYQGRRVGSRNVVITADLNPDPALGQTVDGLREMLYKAFVDPLVEADYVRLLFHDDVGRVRYLVGYTEKFETDIFDIETMVQISMICPDPYIRDNEEIVLSNDTGWMTVPFTYQGSAVAGFTTIIHVNTATSTLTLENNGKKMVLNKAFAVGDIVKVVTTPGQREITVKSIIGPDEYGPEIPIIAYLTPTSPWIELHSQHNSMRAYGSTPNDFIAVIRELRYTQAYWGF